MYIFDYTFTELEQILRDDQINPHHTKALWGFLYRHRDLNLLPPPLRRWIDIHLGENKRFEWDPMEVADEIHSSDGLTRKFLLRLGDGQVIETVLMGYEKRHTVCVSSQAGCAMGCVFCATGQMGFVRDLRPGEIVAQVLHARKVLKRYHPDASLKNMVMMGMGEPLNNYDAVLKALEIISDERGISMTASKITISTVGVVPNIKRLAEEKHPYSLAVSLHGSNEEERRALVPVSKRWPLDMLVQSCRDYCDSTGKKIFFGWTLIDDKNDSPETAERLAQLLQGMDAHINLIPLNPTAGYNGEPSESGKKFQQILRQAGFPCTFRQRRGIDVAAGCGMLKATKVKAS
ncbi:23S rRNA (adenine(2503)-C(2))-methyltransferase RlmN [Kiritimatiellota bacterium B12222]|nr:23S rRNA (adenine(2503)-C(2))-methyltransferase RlmN [Kiritimatiellota bacterium B12222]